jgi:hypothetical protein
MFGDGVAANASRSSASSAVEAAHGRPLDLSPTPPPTSVAARAMLAISKREGV